MSEPVIYTRNPMIRRIGERDNWMCWLCGLAVAPDLSPSSRIGPTLDHVLPRSRGGADHPDNLRLAHAYCNHQRRNRVSNINGRRFARELAERVRAYQRKRRYRVGATR